MRTTFFNLAKLLISILATAAFLSGCGTGSTTTTTATTTTTSASVASLILSATPITVSSDNSTPATFTLTSVSSSNAAVPGVVVTLSTDTGLLDQSTVTTDANGIATFTFKAGGANRSNRTATITAAAGSISKQYPIQITGSTATMASTNGSLPDNGASTSTVTITAKDSAGTAVPFAVVDLAQTGTGVVSFAPVSGVTNASGQFTSTVTGTTAGSTVVTATALGATATSNFTVTPSASTLSVASSTLTPCTTYNSATSTCTAFGAAGTPTTNPVQVSMKIGDTLAVTVNAPGATNVRFISTLGTWTPLNPISPSLATVSGATEVAVVGGTATATLSTTQAGIATVYVDNPATPTANASMSVSMTATAAASITLQASPSLLSKSVGTTKGVSTLLATVTDANGMPVGDAPIAFSILNPTGGGETVTPALALSASSTTNTLGLGQAIASFTTGSMSSGQKGVYIRAQVLGTSVATEAAGINLTASGNDAAIVIGGSAGSIAWGSATVLTENINKTGYVLAMSVTVADANGNPAPDGTVVNLSAWPIAWTTGSNCLWDADTSTTGTFLNEDANENLFLDTTEDGVRKYYATGTTTSGGFTSSAVTTKDALITPINSAGGTVPGTVTTVGGLATFDLAYGKNSALWTITRLRARTTVQGSEAMSELQFRLSALISDVGTTAATCLLPDSPYTF